MSTISGRELGTDLGFATWKSLVTLQESSSGMVGPKT